MSYILFRHDTNTDGKHIMTSKGSAIAYNLLNIFISKRQWRNDKCICLLHFINRKVEIKHALIWPIIVTIAAPDTHKASKPK